MGLPPESRLADLSRQEGAGRSAATVLTLGFRPYL